MVSYIFIYIYIPLPTDCNWTTGVGPINGWWVRVRSLYQKRWSCVWLKPFGQCCRGNTFFTYDISVFNIYINIIIIINIMNRGLAITTSLIHFTLEETRKVSFHHCGKTAEETAYLKSQRVASRRSFWDKSTVNLWVWASSPGAMWRVEERMRLTGQRAGDTYRALSQKKVFTVIWLMSCTRRLARSCPVVVSGSFSPVKIIKIII